MNDYLITKIRAYGFSEERKLIIHAEVKDDVVNYTVYRKTIFLLF